MQLHFPLNPATGAEDATQLPWTNGNPSSGVEGSYPPFAMSVEAMTEIVNALVQAGLTPSSTDLFQLTRAIRGGQLDFGATDTGTADAMVCQIGLAHTAVKAGLPFTFIKGPNANTGAFAPSLTITDLQGNNGVTGALVKATGGPLAKGDLPGNALITVRAISAGVFALVSLVTFSDLMANTAAQLVASPDPASLLYNPEFLVCMGNYDFPVSSVSPTNFTLTAGQVVYDGWRGGAGGCTINIGGNGFITVTGVLEQVVEAPAVAGETLTMCFDDVSGAPLPVTLTDGTNAVSGTVPIGTGTQSVTLAVPPAQTGNLIVQVGAINTTITWRRPRLIRGNAPRTFVRRPMVQELASCQRFFYSPGRTAIGERRVDPATVVGAVIGMGQALTSTTAQIDIKFSQYMYRKPTLEVVNPAAFSVGNASGTTASSCTAISLSSIGPSKDGALLNVTLSSAILNPGDAVCLYFTAGSQRLFFHAEP